MAGAYANPEISAAPLPAQQQAAFEIQAIAESDLPQCAMFLHEWHKEQSSEFAIGNDPAAILKLLHWLLIENPCRARDQDLGYCVRSEHGIEGLILCFPAAFLQGDNRLRGFGSGSYFVRPAARMQGFFLLRRYISRPGYDFYFGTTCNSASGALWTKCRASAIPNSQMEYLVPLRREVILGSFVNSKTAAKLPIAVSRLAGRALDWLLGIPQSSRSLVVSPCDDWEKLSALFYRHRVHDWLTTDRSASYLEWRYGPRSPNGPAEIFTFQNSDGREGWFAVAKTVRGRNRDIHGSILLDAVWPREYLAFPAVLRAILGCRSVAQSDALFLSPRLGVSYRDCRPCVIARDLRHPQAFILAAKGRTTIDSSRIDLVPADGDSAL